MNQYNNKTNTISNQQEIEDEIIIKYIHGEPLTLNEAAIALYMYDKGHGIKSKKPMSAMGFLKMEQRILNKLKIECKKRYIDVDCLKMFEKIRCI
jgi:hypothetical protein